MRKQGKKPRINYSVSGTSADFGGGVKRKDRVFVNGMDERIAKINSATKLTLGYLWWERSILWAIDKAQRFIDMVKKKLE